jgi:hypothetical protein
MRIVSKNQKSTAAQVTAEDPVVAKTVQFELHKSNIHGRSAVAKPLITESNAEIRKP